MEPDVVAYAYNPAMWKAEMRRLQLEASPGQKMLLRPFLKKKQKQARHGGAHM
jgi:hypothetical protein